MMTFPINMVSHKSHVPVTINQMIYIYINPNKSPFSHGFPMVFLWFPTPKFPTPIPASAWEISPFNQDAGADRRAGRAGAAGAVGASNGVAALAESKMPERTGKPMGIP